ELVLEPAALALFSPAGCELVPVLIDLLLRLTVHHEREGLAELEQRAAVQRRELLALELEVHDHHGAFGPRSRVAVAAHGENLGILEDRYIELRRLFGVAVEPEEWRDLLHTNSP